VIERELSEKLQRSVLSPAAIDYCFHRLEAELLKQLSQLDSSLENKGRRKVELDAENRKSHARSC
jgi:hypothetical protein